MTASLGVRKRWLVLHRASRPIPLDNAQIQQQDGYAVGREPIVVYSSATVEAPNPSFGLLQCRQ
jgi:hypothetical protein